ncbi:hypothetical protein K438DRAFT_567199 [Mycena galopus ATCC 62051]|nr:hypothetical protein K438DRAFT_567199 [Mycena galopus ATCC 62051]
MYMFVRLLLSPSASQSISSGASRPGYFSNTNRDRQAMRYDLWFIFKPTPCPSVMKLSRSESARKAQYLSLPQCGIKD